MPGKDKIKVYDTPAFTARFMARELEDILRDGFDKFLIVKVEEMYRHVTGPVPPSRSVTHSCIYLTEGAANMKIGSGHYTIHKDEMLFVPAGQVFSFEEHDVNKGYLCNFHDDILIGKFGKRDLLKDFEFFQVWGNHSISLDKQTSRFVLHLFERIFFEYTENGLQHLDIIQPYFITLLCEVNRVYKPLPATAHTPAAGISNRFRELVFANIHRMHLVADYAALLNISPNHLNKSVKAATGKSPTKWIDEAIVAEAKVLLSQSRLSISEVSAAVGIEDQSYFTRLFRKYENLTPTAFRKMIEKS